eukprot:scaffold1920_cov32-Phaeocystis_antarctica.AAC.3
MLALARARTLALSLTRWLSCETLLLCMPVDLSQLSEREAKALSHTAANPNPDPIPKPNPNPNLNPNPNPDPSPSPNPNQALSHTVADQLGPEHTPAASTPNPNPNPDPDPDPNSDPSPNPNPNPNPNQAHARRHPLDPAPRGPRARAHGAPTAVRHTPD